MKLSSLHVAVVGGAIGGASCALLLARAGARVTLLEKAAQARAVGAGIALAENGLAVLEGLGFGAQLTQIGRGQPGVRVVDGKGRTLLAPSPHTRLVMTRRSELYALLTEALEREPRVEARYGVEVSACHPDGSLSLHAASGPRSLQCDLVVGADGLHSRVRGGGRFGAVLSRPGIRYGRALGPAGLARGEEAWTAGGLFGSFDVADGTYWYASLGTREVERALAARDLPGLRRAWERAYAPSAPLLAALPAIDRLLVNEVTSVRCARFHHGKCVLVGDAAHAMAPNLGQGANSALVDAAVLVQELRDRDSLAQALAHYDARRRPRVDAVARSAARLGALAERTHPALRFVRDRLLMPAIALADADKLARSVWQEDPEQLGRTVRSLAHA